MSVIGFRFGFQGGFSVTRTENPDPSVRGGFILRNRLTEPVFGLVNRNRKTEGTGFRLTDNSGRDRQLGAYLINRFPPGFSDSRNPGCFSPGIIKLRNFSILFLFTSEKHGNGIKKNFQITFFQNFQTLKLLIFPTNSEAQNDIFFRQKNN